MWLKFKFGIFSIIFLSTLVFLTGCLEEPTIAPAKRPFSDMRVINLSNSSNQIFIDDNQPDGSLNDVTVPFTTVYFDINSGKRRFVIKDVNQDTIFNNNVEIISFEREIVVFAGTYDPLSDNDSFSNMKVSEGEVYFNAMPDPGKIHVIATNSFPGYYIGGAEVNPAKLTLRAIHWPDPDSTELFDTTTYISNDDDPLQFGDFFNIRNIDPGSYKFLFLTRNAADNADSLVVSDSSFFSADKRHYLFVYGNPDVYSVFRDEVESLPIRSIN